jgi:hypothetical protein
MKNENDVNLIRVIKLKLICCTKSRIFTFDIAFQSTMKLRIRGMRTSAHGPMDTSSISEWSDHSLAESERACPVPVYATAHTTAIVFGTQFLAIALISIPWIIHNAVSW